MSFSLMGKRLGTEDVQYKTHVKYFEEYPDNHDLLCLENVTEYKQELVESNLKQHGDWKVASVKLDPRHFGLGVGRARIYLLCWRQNKLKWDAPFTLSSFVTSLMARPHLLAEDYFWRKLPRGILTSAEDPVLNVLQQSLSASY